MLDIGTGSGCIPISIKKNLPEINITSVDLSTKAIEIASENADNHQTKIDFKALDFLRLSRFKKQVNWVNSIKFVVPISDQLIHVSGVLSNDSSCIVYDGYLNPSTKTIYWTGFRPEELIVTTHNNYSQYESPSKFLDLTNSSSGLRVDLIYWQAQKIARFNTKKLAFRKDQQTKAVLFEGAFIPFYKVSKIKENGDIMLREFFNY